MAAAWFKKLCDDQGLAQIEVDSAGLSVRKNDSVSENARAVLAESGLIPLRLGSVLVTSRMVGTADLVMTMSFQHYETLVERFPFAASKSRPLMAVLHQHDRDVIDPYGGTLQDYRRCLDMMKPALAALLERIR
jgi:protein-tyrosine phosphatase